MGAALLGRLLELVGGSDRYCVHGSLCFLPLEPYRRPGNDVDAALAIDLFETRRELVAGLESTQGLRPFEIAIVNRMAISRLVPGRSDFVHVETGEGLLDLTLYRTPQQRFDIRLGGGFSLSLPDVVAERSRILEWQGIEYQAAPLELALVPKAVVLAQATDDRARSPGDNKHVEDLRHFGHLIDWDFVSRLGDHGVIRWQGRRLPKVIDRRINPFGPDRLVELRRLVDSLT